MKQILSRVILFLTFVLSSIFSVNVYAEPGDFGFWATLKNLFVPDRANRPVTPRQTLGFYPLTKDDPGFNDGFNPKKYNTWQQVDVPVKTGAMCSNGSPYKFFVRRVPHTSNTIFYFEGGGACWDYATCSGQAGMLGATNLDGIRDGYVQDLNLLNFSSLSSIASTAQSPLIFSHHPWDRYKTGNWNVVYVPYCTGDIYVGDKTQVYKDPLGEQDDIVYHHNGLRNVQAVVSWVKNNLRKPTQLAVTGCSAGGMGALLNYSKVAQDMDTSYSYLVNDSGGVFNAPRSTDDTDNYPQIPAQKRVIDSWTSYDPVDAVSENPINTLVSLTPNLDPDNLGTLYNALADKFPHHRLGMTYFIKDGILSAFSYERFYADIFEDPDPESRLSKVREIWQYDTENNLLPLLDSTSNWSYYFPYFRDVIESHCTTALEFRNSEIEELNLQLTDFLDNVINYRGGKQLRAVEKDTADLHRKDLLYTVFDFFISLFSG